MPTSPADMMAAMLNNMENKTGNTLEYWLKVTAESKEEKHNDIIKFLKVNHGLTHGYANIIAFKHREQFEKPKSNEEMIADQFKAGKSVLLPWYEILRDFIQSLGVDVELAPRKSYVSFRRSKQFAILKASTKSRLDVGLILKGVESTKRLQEGKQFSGMMTHCVSITAEADIDGELKGWLKDAYSKA
ncbi:MAG: DUF4287 domain-containing protein [Candidatus Marinimicrobia bacterium]|nr:DUF4287 domain-containing protein [Candidatus Neomarinimicrobiota bacterium]